MTGETSPGRLRWLGLFIWPHLSLKTVVAGLPNIPGPRPPVSSSVDVVGFSASRPSLRPHRTLLARPPRRRRDAPATDNESQTRNAARLDAPIARQGSGPSRCPLAIVRLGRGGAHAGGSYDDPGYGLPTADQLVGLRPDPDIAKINWVISFL
jgi:hypothetical protein